MKQVKMKFDKAEKVKKKIIEFIEYHTFEELVQKLQDMMWYNKKKED